MRHLGAGAIEQLGKGVGGGFRAFGDAVDFSFQHPGQMRGLLPQLLRHLGAGASEGFAQFLAHFRQLLTHAPARFGQEVGGGFRGRRHMARLFLQQFRQQRGLLPQLLRHPGAGAIEQLGKGVGGGFGGFGDAAGLLLQQPGQMRRLLLQLLRHPGAGAGEHFGQRAGQASQLFVQPVGRAFAAFFQLLGGDLQGFGETCGNAIDAAEEGGSAAFQLPFHGGGRILQRLVQARVDALKLRVQPLGEGGELGADGGAGILEDGAGGFRRLLNGGGKISRHLPQVVTGLRGNGVHRLRGAVGRLFEPLRHAAPGLVNGFGGGGAGFLQAGAGGFGRLRQVGGGLIRRLVDARAHLLRRLVQPGGGLMRGFVQARGHLPCHRLHRFGGGGAGLLQRGAGGIRGLMDGGGDLLRHLLQLVASLGGGGVHRLGRIADGGFEPLRHGGAGPVDGLGGGGAGFLHGGAGGFCHFRKAGGRPFRRLVHVRGHLLCRFAQPGGGILGGSGQCFGGAGLRLLHGEAHPFRRFADAGFQGFHLGAQHLLLLLDGVERGFQCLHLFAKQGGDLVPAVEQGGGDGIQARGFLVQGGESALGAGGRFLQRGDGIGGGGAHVPVRFRQARGRLRRAFLQLNGAFFQALQHGRGFVVQRLADFHQRPALAVQAADEGVQTVLVLGQGPFHRGQLLARLHVQLAGALECLVQLRQQALHLRPQALAQGLHLFGVAQWLAVHDLGALQHGLGYAPQLARPLEQRGGAPEHGHRRQPHGGHLQDPGQIRLAREHRQIDDGGERRPQRRGQGRHDVGQGRGRTAQLGDERRQRGVVLIGRRRLWHWLPPGWRDGGLGGGGCPVICGLRCLCHGSVHSDVVGHPVACAGGRRPLLPCGSGSGAFLRAAPESGLFTRAAS